MVRWVDKESAATYARLGELAAEAMRSGGRINRNRERDGMVPVLDEAQEVHAAFAAVASLAESALENDIERLRGGDLAARDRLIDALSLFGIGYSWGGFESLALGSHPERDRDVLPWPPRGIDPDNRHAVRLWIGLEDPTDLIADLERGLAAWRQ